MRNPNFFNTNKFKKNLKTNYIGKKIIYFEKVDSTNNYASALEKNLNKKQKLDSSIIISETQTSGRGRSDRIWLSPMGGLWFTLILIPDLAETHLPKLTLISAASIFSALKKDYKIYANIKWPNDIYWNNFKIGGILTECEKSCGSTFVNIGIGLNVNISKEDISMLEHKLETEVYSLSLIRGKNIKRELLLAQILYYFEKYYDYFIKTKDFNKIFSIIKNYIIY